MTQVISASPSTAECLRTLSGIRPESFQTPGGRVMRLGKSHWFRVSSLLIAATAPVVILADSRSLPDRQELFIAHASGFRPDDHVPRPQYAPVDPAAGLDLQDFINVAIYPSLLRSPLDPNDRSASDPATIEDGIILDTGDKRLLLSMRESEWETDETFVPLDFVMTVDPATQQQRLRSTQLVDIA
jgi:hypothetical protein